MRRGGVEVYPSQGLRLTASLAGDKSVSHRAVMLASIARGTTVIRNFLDAEDTWKTIEAFRSMGVSIQCPSRGRLRIRGGGLWSLKAPRRALDCGNSGTTMRILAGILSAQPFDSVLLGDRSLSRRPMDRVIEPLNAMGGCLVTRKSPATAPILIRGKRLLHGIRYRLPVPSAQVKSAILFAGLYTRGTTVVYENIRTRDHTERFFRLARLPVHTGPHRTVIRGGKEPRAFSLDIPGDISSAAFLIAAALVVPGSRVRLRGLLWNPTRAGFIRVLRRMGAKIRISRRIRSQPEESVDMEIRFSTLKGTVIRKGEVPTLIDELPILMVVASQAKGSTWIHGAGELKHKETDRMRSMTTQLKRMGAAVDVRGESIRIRGPRALEGSVIESFGDHRTAMSFVIAGLIARGMTRVHDVENIRTSFPNFFSLLKKAGCRLKAPDAFGGHHHN